MKKPSELALGASLKLLLPQDAPVSAQNLHMNFMHKFPNISLKLDDVLVYGTLEEDTLLFCKNLYIEFGILSILKGETIIKKISAYEGKLNLKWNTNGENNYSILKPISTNSNSYKKWYV